MDEGKPTKAKWWGRPRPQGTGAESGPGGGAPVPGEGDRDRDGDGDFELARPAGISGPAEGAASTSSASASPVGLDKDADGGDADDGDFELERPAPRRPEPLHAPDPYSTPPYGRPGPWAPAPPVQHPAAALTQDTRAQGAHAPGSRAEAATPAHGTHLTGGIPPQSAPFGAAPQDAPPPAPAGQGFPHVAEPAASAESAAPDPWQNYDPWAAPGPLQQNGVGVPTAAQRRRRTRKALVLGALALALVSGGVGGAAGAYLERNGGLTDVELPQAAKEAPGRAPDSVAGIAAHALPSVVTLHVRGSEEEGTGTGFVLDGQGHILTNNHVIEPAGGSGEISVTFSGGETAKAELVGHDSGYDLAVVKVSGVRGLSPMPLGNSDNVQVGDPVVAIGAPFDLANTVTSGIISAKERPITAGGEKGDGTDVSYVDALQTDAPINPGNSGGPLLDTRARVIGINSAIRSADSGSGLGSGQAGSIGLGFAIPVNQAKRVAEELINTGRATHPVIGVTLDMEYDGDGARVTAKAAGGGPSVTAGGPGAKAGIKAGDVITEVDGRRVHSGEELIVKTRAHRPGDRLRLTLRRGGAEKTVTLVLGSASGD
ncbi:MULTISPECIES: S1C family serine protease [unclassified Streptomyces]|uniref:S1C family serine protease n=1 Tax=unclassified Streptomyces TaxID=2593676 RepID=UPI00224EEA24|nr:MULTISPECIES: trypsin-like peptidase domain-containing protein [unclassified Streptomyces]MCX4988637.1 trypsin-like peptidase domain-containing protein [Streptomyces sp. NBC_00568]MCX5006141.1 trypsin-like peptidase domain-containing protein [Streptomyces sp. NBC_00638]